MSADEPDGWISRLVHWIRTVPSPSAAYLRFAILSTVLVFVIGNLGMLMLVRRASQEGVATARSMPVDAPVLTVAVARTPGSAREWTTYAKVIAHMQERVDCCRIQVRYVPDRNDVIELFRAGEVDVGFLCTYCYLKLAEEGEVAALATPIINGVTEEAAVVVTSSSSDYRSLQDLEGCKVGVSHPTSLGGCAYLLWLMEREGLNPDFVEFVRGRTQEANLTGVIDGTLVATVVNRSQLAGWPQERFRILASSDEFGMPPIVVSAQVDPALRERLLEALLEVKEMGLLSDQSIVDGFLDAALSDYGFAKELMVYTECEGEP